VCMCVRAGYAFLVAPRYSLRGARAKRRHAAHGSYSPAAPGYKGQLGANAVHKFSKVLCIVNFVW
jgi:hypothetical protein